MMILDTNVVSELMKPTVNAGVLAWLNRRPDSSFYVTSINLAEILEGIALLPDGRRKENLRIVADRVLADFVTPPLDFDRRAAVAYTSIVLRAKARRYTLPIMDAQIAAIAAVHGFTVATRDVEPFLAAGVPVVNPWEE
jgi:predicted nucleic acid-binding protein